MANSALIPIKKLENDFYNWEERHTKILKQVAEKKFDLVFIGDSITHLFEDTKLWQETLYPLNAINLGFGWDRTQNVIWRIGNGQIAGQNPKLIILNIGTNNFSATENASSNTPAEITDAIKKIYELLHEKTPDSHITIMGVFPRETPESLNYLRVKQLNELLDKEFSERENVSFIDIGNSFVLPDGSLNKTFYTPDLVHLTDNGYNNWWENIKSVVEKHLNLSM